MSVEPPAGPAEPGCQKISSLVTAKCYIIVTEFFKAVVNSHEVSRSAYRTDCHLCRLIWHGGIFTAVHDKSQRHLFLRTYDLNGITV